MQGLYELLNLMPSDFIPNFSPRLNKLYSFLQEREGLTQQEANIEYLGNKARAKYFRELILDLKKELIRYLLAYPSWKSHSQKATYEQHHRDFAMYRILLAHNKRTTAIEMAKTLLPKLQKWELHSMAHIVADDIINHYTVIKGSQKMLKKYKKVLQEELEHTKVYLKVRQYYARVNSIGNTRESYTKAIIKEFDRIAKTVTPLLHPKRYNTNRFIYNIIVSKYLSVHDYPNLLRCCDEALDSFPSNIPNIRSFRFMFLFHKITGLTAIGKLNEAKEVARAAQDLMPVGNFNWHVILLKRIIVCLHNKEYQEAYQLYKAHQKQKCISPIITEYWNIIKGYLYFLIQVKLVEPYEKERFYLGKFLNEMPLYSKDKAGNNINILIIQILVQITRGQYVKIIDRIDSLREYVRLYTRNEETKRANIFMKMIIKMEAARFHRKGTEAKTKTLVQKLNTTPLRTGQNLAIEIIPYEVLWQEMLDMIDNKFRATTIRKKSADNSHKPT